VRGSDSGDPSSANPPRSADRAYRLTISPDPISLGTLGNGQSAKAAAFVRNPGAGAVTIERIDTSCPCLRALLEPTTIGPGETGRITLSFDPKDEPDFQGELSIEVVGYEIKKEVAFRTFLRATVGMAVVSQGHSVPNSQPVH